LARNERLQLIREIEEKRKSRLLAAIWGDRLNLPALIASDVHPVIFEHLEKIGKVPKIDVLLYTTGGQTLAAWAIANMLREYCDNLAILIPHRALSAGTLLTLAADEVLMSRAAHLSPIDPSLTSPLGPRIEAANQPGVQQVVPISVEDVVGFLDLATKQAELKEERSILAVFDRLSTQVHPLALGAVFRTRQQIVSLADRLLQFHMKGDERKEDRERIVGRLTRELGSHDYLIGRTEAKDFFKLNVVDFPPDVEPAMLKLFSEYSALLELRSQFNLDGFLGTQANRSADMTRAIVETADQTDVYRTTLQAQRPAPAAQPVARASFEGWVTVQDL